MGCVLDLVRGILACIKGQVDKQPMAFLKKGEGGKEDIQKGTQNHSNLIRSALAPGIPGCGLPNA